jgi:hypothetical protein
MYVCVCLSYIKNKILKFKKFSVTKEKAQEISFNFQSKFLVVLFTLPIKTTQKSLYFTMKILPFIIKIFFNL